jgi:hypothetical protein
MAGCSCGTTNDAITIKVKNNSDFKLTLAICSDEETDNSDKSDIEGISCDNLITSIEDLSPGATSSGKEFPSGTYDIHTRLNTTGDSLSTLVTNDFKISGGEAGLLTVVDGVPELTIE